MTAHGRPEPACGWIQRAGEGGVAVGRWPAALPVHHVGLGQGSKRLLVALLVVSLLL